MHSPRFRCARAFALLLALAACGRGATPRADSTAASSPAAPSVERDDFGDPIPIGRAAQRIVSLNPTTTEMLFALGVGGRVVGRTHWDTWPEAAKAVPDLGNGIRPNVEAVLAARPDLVLLYASADNRDAAQALRAAGIPVVALKIDRIAHFERTARLLGDLVGAPRAGRTMADTVAATIARVRRATAALPKPRVVWPLYGEPLFVVGAGSFLSELLDAAGATNVFADLPQPSPRTSREEILRRDADAIVAGPTTIAKLREEPAWRALTAVRTGRLLVVDTALLLRPSVQLGQAAVMLAELLHPGAVAGAVAGGAR